MRNALLNSVRALLIATLLTLALSASALAQDDATGQLGPESQAIAAAINDVRAQNGLPVLRVNALLNQAAQAHVDDLIANNMYGHYGSDGSSVRTRVGRTGYPSSWVSENWVTSSTPGGAMTWWMNDWIHRVNILESHWDEVGIGAGMVSNGYWIFVTDFANSGGQGAPAPVASAPAAAQAPAIESSVPAGGMDYTIQPGDTLLAIGLRYDIEWQDIAVANSVAEANLLQVGQTLRLPGAAAATAAAVADLPSGGLLYTVNAGDTLISIASRYAIEWQDVAAANGIADPSLLQLGMQLRLPGVPEEGAAESEAEGEGAEVAASEAADAQVAPSDAVETYVVKSGDTLSAIAGRNGLTWQELAKLNGLGPAAVLQIGQSLQLPLVVASASSAPEVSGPPATTDPPFSVTFTTELLNLSTDAESVQSGGTGGPVTTTNATYTVKSGDTIISIAVRNSINWKRLLEINNLDEDAMLQPGQVIALE